MAGEADIATQIFERGPWYHTFDLPGGGSTDGFYDLRTVPDKIGLPRDLSGMRCLDAAACEGFWSFEMAKRGAAEVVSVDLADTTEQDWQGDVSADEKSVGTGMANDHFELMREALGHDQVVRRDLNVYDVSPETVGEVDFVFIGNILIHLADPSRALRAIGTAMKPGARLLSLEPASLTLSLLSPRVPMGQLWDVDDQPRWWTPNIAAHKRLVHAAGLKVERSGGPFFQPFGKGAPSGRSGRQFSVRAAMYRLIVRRLGVSSSWVQAVRT